MRQLFYIFLIILLSLAAYSNTFSSDFVWDDRRFIVENLQIRSLANVPHFFFNTVDGLYRPLRTSLYAANYSLWGLNPFGYHLNSLLWHSLSAVMVYLVLSQLAANKFVPAAAASIFAVHPIHYERVTFITGGFDLLGIFLLLLSFYLYVLFSRGRNYFCFAASALSFVLALFASEEALVLPLLILLYEFVYGNKLNKKMLMRLAPFIVIVAVFVLFRFFVIGLGARAAEYPAGSFIATALTMPKVFLYYLYLVFVPHPLALYRQVETVANAFNLILLLSIAVFAAILVFAVKHRRQNKLLAFSAGWFLITLLPFSNILPLQTLMADRYLYLPSMAASAVAAFFIFKVRKQMLAAALAAVVVLLFIFVSADKNTEWKDDIALWESAAKRSSDSAVFSNLGFAYEQGGRLDDAEAALSKAISLNPSDEKAHYNLGIVYMRLQDYNRAADSFLAAVDIKEDYARAYDALGLVYYFVAGQKPGSREILWENAELSFAKAIEADPNYYKSYSDFGILRAQQGSFQEAEQLFKKSLQLNPWNHEAFFNLGILYGAAGYTDLAEQNFLMAAGLQPDNALYRSKIRQ